MIDVRKKGFGTGLMFSCPIVSLTLYPLLFFSPGLFISLVDSNVQNGRRLNTRTQSVLVFALFHAGPLELAEARYSK
jgi:hypothetical protein